jgi:hypothetical protein
MQLWRTFEDASRDDGEGLIDILYFAAQLFGIRARTQVLIFAPF